MSLNPEWTITCRVCLQEGDIRSLFDVCPQYNLTYCAKVMQCTGVEIRRNDTLPEQICVQCIGDLNVAYRFRLNCESSDAILQSYRQATRDKNERERQQNVCQGEDSCSSSEIQIPISSDVVYSYKPPSGLNVKLVSRECTVLLENNGEIIICEPSVEPKTNLKEQYDVTSVQRPPEDQGAEDDEEDNDSLITYDDALPPSALQLDNDDQEIGGKETDERTDVIDDLVENDTQNSGSSEQHPGDVDADIYFDNEFVYIRKNNTDQEQIVCEKLQDNIGKWEYDEANSNEYLEKNAQPKIVESVPERTTDGPVPQQSAVQLTNPIKTIQTIRKANIPNEEKPTIENIITKPGPDGSLETVIRVKRNLKMVTQQHVCKLCNSSYKYKHALETHLRRHRGDKPYKCTDCEKAFVVPFELRRHMRTHTGAKPYKCKYCEKKFSDFGSKIKHERTHTGERPYTCEVCKKSFTYSHVLNSHMLIHTGVKKYSCPDCGKRFTKSHHLKTHLNTHTRSSAGSNCFAGKCSRSGVPSVLATLNLDQPDSDHLLVDGMDNRSAEFQLEDTSAAGNPFGQLVNLSDYMIAPKTESTSIGTLMGDCVIHDGGGSGHDVGDVTDDEDALLNVVTVLTSNQVVGLVEGDYANIRIINE
ncbi:zinc finger and SCAN domain-containing protein 29-like isoform X2 [Toxorhynchites rutilus septentrionalis]|uniref:zinc finger and SCAN domain-containing protein 29-like isoform X2 n=1 Tax=Toxorhynchites rutilus septentrionalis TaxID=329112 RepID=UPI0024787236|nr:zinc finger and SCAN domain-containing protein 29-like isoform X2 [Toxorhynchites rutilus septentrionalis]